MAVNKVVLGEDTLIDLTADTVSADKLSKGITAHDMAGEPIVGTMEAGGGKVYTFTDGLTETNGTVKWDLNDTIFHPASGDVGSIAIGYRKKPSGLDASGKGSFVFGHAGISGKIISYYDGGIAGGYAHSGTISTSNGGITLGTAFKNLRGNSFSICLGYASKYAVECNDSGTVVIGIGENGKMQANASGAIAIGNGVIANQHNQIALGICNMSDTNNDYLMIVGNGTSDTSRSNAYTLDWQGNGTFAGTVSSSTGADYAEYFEWKDGNPNNEDRVGYIVTLDGDKIVKANTGDDVLGICSGTAMVLGDSAEWNWSKRYLTDDFGRIIYEDYDVEHEEIKDEETGKVIEEAWTEHIHAPKQNPEYDASQPYVKRADRPEWQIVGMMGKIYVRDDGSCVVNGYADVKDGIATKASGKTNMRVMERVTDNIVRVLMK